MTHSVHPSTCLTYISIHITTVSLMTFSDIANITKNICVIANRSKNSFWVDKTPLLSQPVWIHYGHCVFCSSFILNSFLNLQDCFLSLLLDTFKFYKMFSMSKLSRQKPKTERSWLRLLQSRNLQNTDTRLKFKT